MRRLLIRLGLVTSIALGFIVATGGPSLACHWGGVGCGEPEEAPFNPQGTGSVDDARTSAHADTHVGWTQEAHEQFVTDIEIDAPPEFDIDLDVPAEDERIGTLAIVAIVQGENTDIPGKVWDRNDGVNWPDPNGVYKWELEINATTGDFFVDAFADLNAPDGHLHIETSVPDDLREQAQLLDASVLSIDTELFGEVAGGPFQTNPAVAGTYTATMFLRAWDDPGNALAPGEATVEITYVIEDRVPNSVAVTPANQTKRVGQTASVTAEVKDQGDEALPGAVVDFSVSGTNPGLKCDDVVTGNDGKASCSYTGTNGGNDTVTATATKNGGSASGTASVHWREPTTIDLTPATADKRVGTTHTLTATVKDQDGQVMQGETVGFTRTGANPGSGSGTTNASGQATHTYTGNNGGDDTIAATVTVIGSETISDTSSAHWNRPATVTLTPATATLVEDQQHTVTATVKDQDGDPMAGETVSFTRTGANPGSGSGTTNASGQATHTYTGANPGDDTITGEVTVLGSEKVSGSATAHWNAAVPTTLTLTPETADRSVGQSVTETAEVRDQINRAMSGVSVHFAVTGANPSSGDRTTGADGKAAYTYTGASAGTDTVTATVNALTDTSTVTWTNLVPTTLESTLTYDNMVGNQPVGYGYPQHHTATVRALVKDQNGDPMPNVDVEITITSGPNATGQFDQVLTTGADGRVTWQYSGRIANGEGTDNVRVHVSNTNLTNNHSMTWKWHPCDNPNAISLGLPIEGGFDYSQSINGNVTRVVICWNKPHQHTN
ncbi:MAG: Ig-like domain-containing protein [Actinobacteria bacterium]|nr:Ig-like domain-containing protein [Actinomycetota bacterium]